MTRDKRDNKVPEVGLMLDKDNNVFDRTEWLKRNDLLINILCTHKEQLKVLKQIETHLSVMTDEELADGDEN